MDQLIAQYPNTTKYLALVGLGYMGLSLVCNFLVLVAKTFQLENTAFGRFVGHLLELVANLPALWLRVTKPDPNGPIVRAVALFVVLPLALAASSCATLKAVQPQLVACEEHAIASQAESIIPVAAQALSGTQPGVDWAAQLDQLLVSQGMAAICAVEVVVSASELQGAQASVPASWSDRAMWLYASSAANAPNVPNWLVCSRGHAWLQALHVRHTLPK